MNNKAIVKGSIQDLAVNSGKPMALAFLDIDYVAIVDTSGSMSDMDSRGGRSRYDVACEELKALQGENPGKILVISFSGNARLCLGGIPEYQGGSTDLAGALRFAKQYDLPAMTFFVISDGYPDNAQAALNEAAKLEGVINTIFVGPERDAIGREFLARLAEKNGGKTALAEKGDLLAKQFKQLLLKG